MTNKDFLDLLEELWMDCITDTDKNNEMFLKPPDTAIMLKAGRVLAEARKASDMSKYKIGIKTVSTIEIEVEAGSQYEANQKAYEIFKESYQQEYEYILPREVWDVEVN